MSLAFESPTTRMNNATNEAYFTPLNMPGLMNKEESSTGSNNNSAANTPYYTAPINPAIHQEFLNAIQNRHATQPTILSPITNMNVSPLAMRRNNSATASPNMMTMSSSTSTSSSSILAPMESSQLEKIIDNPHVLILDVRSFVQYSHSRIRHAINISIPNTILKRPTFTLSKVYDAIVLDQAREKLKSWESAEHIVFYDQQSNILQENSASAYLGAKLIRAGFNGKLHYLKGGFEVFSNQYKSLCESSNTNLETTPATKLGPPTIGGESSFLLNLPKGGRPKLRLNNMPTPSLGPFTAPMPQFDNQAFNPFFSNIRQNMELSHGPIRERFPIRLPPQCNVDLNDAVIVHCKDISPRCIAGGQFNPQDHTFVPPAWLKATMGEQGTQRLAETYESIERTEQRRLQNIMHFHSKHTDNPAEYPFSIVAGIEMGALNRYTNIWPYEYTRVKIAQPKGSDYINASFIQYIDSNESASDARPEKVHTECVKLMKENKVNQPYRRYISTQGPLPATFHDFWQVVWEQNSRVLVMLTKEEEMNKIKCHRYWPSDKNTPLKYGDFTVTLLEEIHEQIPSVSSQQEINPDDVIITRKLLLENSNKDTREVTHLHYTGWMDFGVPDNPLGTLQVIQKADEVQTSFGNTIGPMIVHCSAGCGRSGAFCTIDTVLHRLTNPSCTKKEEAHDILLETISRFREQRLSMVQTLRQFVFCYEAIWWWLLGYGPNRLYQDDNMDTSS